jgi:phage tail-like protein
VNGWLVGQLPAVMTQDQVVRGFAGAAEEIGDSFRRRTEGIEHELDVHLASPAMLAYLAGWLGFPLDELDGPDFNAAVLAVVARTLGTRGTAAGLRALLETLTGAPVEVVDPGGVYGPGDAVPPYDPVVTVRLAQVGPRGQARLAAILDRELPVGVRVDVSWPPAVAPAEEQ